MSILKTWSETSFTYQTLAPAFKYKENRASYEDGVILFNPLSNNTLMIDLLTDSIITFISAGEVSYSVVFREFEAFTHQDYFNRVISQLIDQDIIDAK